MNIICCSSEKENQDPQITITCATPEIELTEITLEDATFSTTATNSIQIQYGSEGFSLRIGTTFEVAKNTVPFLD